MSGSWSGSGTITTSSGNKERIRCRARYDVDGGGSSLDLMLRCASDSYNFELQSNATHSNGAVSGTWSENTRHVGGNIEGSARGNAINLRVSGVISATLGVSTNANQQSISIQAPGTELQSVAISISRAVAQVTSHFQIRPVNCRVRVLSRAPDYDGSAGLDRLGSRAR